MASREWTPVDRATLVVVCVAAGVFLPFLGSVGLWDPWETHYAEVAREMLASGDFVHPRWERSWFFSKPPLTMWLAAGGMFVATRYGLLAGGLAAAVLVLVLGRARGGWTLTLAVSALACAGVLTLATLALLAQVPWRTGDLLTDVGALPLATEWGVRLPFAAASIASIGMLSLAVGRVAGARVGLLTGLALTTMPMQFLLARQAVTDPLLVGATTAGVGCALVALVDEAAAPRWWLGAWLAFALGTLAKGWLAFLVPAAVFAGALVLFEARWASLGEELRWFGGLLRARGPAMAGAGVAAGAVAFTVGRATGLTFLSGPPVGGGLPGRGHDLLGPSAWFALTMAGTAAWLAGVLVKRREPPPTSPVARALCATRPGAGVLLFLAVTLPWYLVMFTFPGRDDEGNQFWFRFVVHDHLSRYFSGVHSTTPTGSFAYFVEQLGYAVFPWVIAVPGAIGLLTTVRLRGATPRDRLVAVAALWLAVTWLSAGNSATKFHHYAFPMLPPLAILIGVWLDELWEKGTGAVSLALGGALFLLVAKDLWRGPKAFTDLFVYNSERPWPEHLFTRAVLGGWSTKDLLERGALFALALAAAAGLSGGWPRAIRAWSAVAVLFASAFSWSLWPELSHHWTQRDQFWRYFTHREPTEPIAAFLMNWRGETFYSRNTVIQIPAQNTAVELDRFLSRAPRVWVLVEHARLGVLRQMLGGRQVELFEPELNNKFVLLRVTTSRKL